LTHFYDVQAWLPRNVVFVNKDAWEALDEATKKVVTDCGEKTAADGTTKSKELSGQYLKTLADNGMKVTEPSAQLKSELNAFGETMTQEWSSSAGEDGKAIIDAYKAK
jgi:TRAP-type C4-dicarboxylate transport system substrate-binding protein